MSACGGVNVCRQRSSSGEKNGYQLAAGLNRWWLGKWLSCYGYSKERFVWSLISIVGIFYLGSGATIVHSIQNLCTSQEAMEMMVACSAMALAKRKQSKRGDNQSPNSS
ncbi:Metal tolerance protein C4 [Camellia lanceoleosa]|uniref:Metal tolerance protein C4 n=1 Tax=Camellia lanceoleosa TaxID=1840588 RepID=A0ACC0IW27_9ERIC|nr:Metal tolerance protein C4 [Camellia lanceoleosa]